MLGHWQLLRALAKELDTTPGIVNLVYSLLREQKLVKRVLRGWAHQRADAREIILERQGQNVVQNSEPVVYAGKRWPRWSILPRAAVPLGWRVEDKTTVASPPPPQPSGSPQNMEQRADAVKIMLWAIGKIGSVESTRDALNRAEAALR